MSIMRVKKRILLGFMSLADHKVALTVSEHQRKSVCSHCANRLWSKMPGSDLRLHLMLALSFNLGTLGPHM